MEYNKDITIQSLSHNSDVQVGYSDDDIVIVDSIQRFTEVSMARVTMNAIVICIKGKVQANMNGQHIELKKNQVGIIPENITVTDVMVSPDFDMKGMFLTKRILQAFLREKISIWNDMMYIHRLHILTMDDEDLLFYTHFYDMLSFLIEKGSDNPFHSDIIQSLMRASMLGLCGGFKRLLPQVSDESSHAPNIHFQRFLELLHSDTVKRRSVDAYADELCITPKYLTVVCKRQSGKTATQWIREAILDDVRYYLKQTDLSVKQIADRLSFPNSSFFSKYVKEHFGMTPMQLRQQ